MARSSNTNDDALSPSLVASLQGSAHNANVTSAVEGVVTSTIRHLDELLLDALVTKLRWVDEVSAAELLAPGFLVVIDVHHDDLRGSVLDCSLNDRQAYTASAEDSNVRPLLDVGSNDSSAVSGGDTTTEQACAIHRGLVGDGNDRDICDDGVLGEGGSAHEVEQVLALTLQSRSSIGHDSFSLGCSDLATQVGLPGRAKLAFATFRGAIRR